jgi:V8-like Glu-specific endopeptidase
MINLRGRGVSDAPAFDADSPFRSWSPAPEAESFPQAEGELEWFEATADTEAPEQEEQETNTACTESGVGITGQDDRQPVTNTLDVPFRWICQIWIRRRDSNGKVTDSGATGVVVGPRHVLTAAHAIKEEKQDSRGQWVSYEATQIRVAPGRDGDERPFGTYEVKLPAQVAPGWTPRGNQGSEHDYALLTLDTAVGDKTFKSLGNQKLCYWGSAACPQATAVRQDPNSLVRATGITGGYPNDRGGGVKPFTVSGQLGGVVQTRRFMNFAADACQGQSGSPVWVVGGGEHRLVGLLVRVQAGGALVIRVTLEFAKQLRDWMGNASDAFASRRSSSARSGKAIAEWELFEEEEQEGLFEEPEAEDGEQEAFAGDVEAENESGYEADVEAFDTELEAEDFASESVAETLEDTSESFEQFDAESGEDRTVTFRALPERPGVEGEPSPAPVRIGKLAFLTRIAAPLDPGIYDGPEKYRIALPPLLLQNLLKEAVKKAGTGNAPIALVDLTKDPGAPDFAGWNHKAQTYPASMAKLIHMFAAFQLRSDLKAIQSALGGAPAAAVFAEARRQWTETQTPPSGTPVATVSGPLGRQGALATWNGKPVALPANSFLPNLETMFEATAGLPFKSKPLGLLPTATCSGMCAEIDEFVILERIERHGNGGDRGHGFLQRQKLAIGFSNNRAATSCIEDIGFPYIASLLMQTGLWDPARGGGLWLGAGYGGLNWRASLLGGGAVTATAGALAALLTLIARDLAVDAASSAAMRALFKKDSYPGGYTRSGFKDGLDKEMKRLGRPMPTVFSKLGLLTGPEYDCAIIERTEGAKRLKYVAVAMNVPGTATMHKLIVALDQCIRANNGL